MKPHYVIRLYTRVTYTHGFGLLQVVPSAKSLSMSLIYLQKIIVIYLQKIIVKARFVECLLCYVSL